MRRNVILKLESEFIMTPRILFNDKNLTKTDIIVLSLILSLALKNGYCYARDDYLTEYINSSVRTINYSLSKLKNLKYIIVKYENNKRRIYLNVEKIPTKAADEGAKNGCEESATYCTHNINSNKYKKKYKKTNANLPYWLEHPESCTPEPMSEEDIVKAKEIMKNFK